MFVKFFRAHLLLNLIWQIFASNYIKAWEKQVVITEHDKRKGQKEVQSHFEIDWWENVYIYIINNGINLVTCASKLKVVRGIPGEPI